MKMQRTVGSTSTSASYLLYDLESQTSIPLAGQTVTLSFWAKAGANYSSTSNGIDVVFGSGTGTDQGGYVTLFTGYSLIKETVFSLTTTWTKYSMTGTVPSNSTQLGMYIQTNGVGTAGADDSYSITGVQLEAGSITTPFSRAGGTLQGELAACRYYYKRNTAGVAYGHVSSLGSAANTTVVTANFADGAMRVAPTSVEYANIGLDDGVSVIAITSVSLPNNSNTNQQIVNLTVASGLTQYRPYRACGNNNAAGYLAVSAEL